MYDFEYCRPTSLPEAVKLLTDDEDARLLAGGMTLIPTLKQRLARPGRLVDLGGLEDLIGIRANGRELTIKAMTPHSAVAASSSVRKNIPALAQLAAGIGDPHVRHRGTIGGSVANNDPAADYPAALLALAAEIHTNRRTIPADQFFTGMFETALENGEIITSVGFPIPQAAAYVKFRNSASRYAMVGIFVARTKSGIRVAVTGAGPCVFRQMEMEEALGRDFSPAALDVVRQSPTGLNDDIHGSAEYRAHLVGILARRAVLAMQ